MVCYKAFPRPWCGPVDLVPYGGLPRVSATFMWHAVEHGLYPPYWAEAFYQGFDAASYLCPAPDLSSLTGLYAIDIALHVVLISVMSVFTLITAWMTVCQWAMLLMLVVLHVVQLLRWVFARKNRVYAVLIVLALCAVSAASWRWQEGLKTCWLAALSAAVGLRDLTLRVTVLVVNKLLTLLGVTALWLAWYLAAFSLAVLSGLILGANTVFAGAVWFAWVLIREGWVLAIVREWLPWREPVVGFAADPLFFTDEERLVEVNDQGVQAARTVVHLLGGVTPPEYALAITRVRRRARWVRALETLLGGRKGAVGTFVRGRWTPDLPAPGNDGRWNYLVASVGNGARVLGGGLEQVDHERNPAHGVYFHLDTGEEIQVVFPYLLGKLRQYALFRERDELLLSALRSRAIEWCKGEGLRAYVSDMAVAGAVSLAMEPSTHEAVAQAHVTRVAAASTPNASL